MGGFISNLAPLLNYLRRRSPGPPFPPDHRQAGERGAITPFSRVWCTYWEHDCTPLIVLLECRDKSPGQRLRLRSFAKVTEVIVTVKVRLRAAGRCKAPPSRLAQRKFCGV